MAVWVRNLPILGAFFSLSAMVFIVPQRLTLEAGPQREALLALILVTGTAAAIGGVRLASARQWQRPRALIAVCILAAAAALLKILSSSSLAGWVLLGMGVRFAGNVAVQLTDQAALAQADETERQRNDTAGLLMRLLGSCAPLVFFGMLGEGWLAPAALGAATLAALLALLTLAPSRSAPRTPPARGRLLQEDWAMLGYGGAIMAGLSMLAGSMMMLLDHHGFASPAAWTGGLLLLIHLGAGALLLLPGRWLGPAWLPPALMGVSVAPALRGGDLLPGQILLGVVLLTAAYAGGLRALRDHASAATRAGRPMLAAYNDLGNQAQLAAFLALGLLSGLSMWGWVPYHLGVPGAALLCAGLGLLCLRARTAALR